MRLTFLIFCGILLLFSCGSDETPPAVEQMPNYFPDAVGTRWVYLNSGGIQETLEVSGETDIEGKSYRILKDTLPTEETALGPSEACILSGYTESGLFRCRWKDRPLRSK